MRKNCRDALARYYVSETAPKPQMVKFVQRMRRATWKQLHKWARRAQERRNDCQAAWQKWMEKKAALGESDKTASAFIDSKLAMLDIMAAGLEQLIDVCQDETIRRKNVTIGEQKPCDSATWRLAFRRPGGRLVPGSWMVA